MPQHRFAIGSVVSLQIERGLSRPQGRYFVEAQLPPLGTALQYRVKNESEGFRRVVIEDQMSSLSPDVTATRRHLEETVSGEED